MIDIVYSDLNEVRRSYQDNGVMANRPLQILLCVLENQYAIQNDIQLGHCISSLDLRCLTEPKQACPKEGKDLSVLSRLRSQQGIGYLCN